VKPVGRPDAIRIEKTDTAVSAVALAFGIHPYPVTSPLKRYDVGTWEAKDAGTRVELIRSDKRRIEVLTSKTGWFDPCAEALP
jgi:hypothetical protein